MNLARTLRESIEPNSAPVGREAFEIAQWATHSRPPRRSNKWPPVLHPAAVRSQRSCAKSRTSPVSRASRTRSSWHPWRIRKVAATANRSRALRQQIERVETRLAALSARLEKEFPDYAELASPKPLQADEVQNFLGPDEALVFFLSGKEDTFVFALTRESFVWQAIALGSGDLARESSLSGVVSMWRSSGGR